MRKSYSHFVVHCMKFYLRYRDKSGISLEIDQLNWQTCDDVLKGLDPEEQDILLTLYGTGIYPRNVADVAARHGIDRRVVWNLIRQFEKTIATLRGLI